MGHCRSEDHFLGHARHYHRTQQSGSTCSAGSAAQPRRELRFRRQSNWNCQGRGQSTSTRPAPPSKAQSPPGPLRHWARLLSVGRLPNHAARRAWTSGTTGAQREQAPRYIQESNRHIGTPGDLTSNDTVADGEQHHDDTVVGVPCPDPIAAPKGRSNRQLTQTLGSCDLDQTTPCRRGIPAADHSTARNPHARIATTGSRKSPDSLFQGEILPKFSTEVIHIVIHRK